MTYLQKASSQDGLEQTFSVIHTSAQRRVKKLLIACEHASDRAAIQNVLAAADIHILDALNGSAILDILREQYLDGIVVSQKLPDLTVCKLVEQLQRQVSPYVPPVIIYGREALLESEAREIRRLANSSRVRLAPSMDRLLDESVLLLHRAENDLTDAQRRTLRSIREYDSILAGRKLLVVDDDIRNIFALTSILEERKFTVLHAEDGRSGVELLKQNPDIDAVLMDIMMPEMDGYETMRLIRATPQLNAIPIVALTAKAMKGDRERCLEAGASDYVTKPIDLEQLLSVLRVWIIRREESKDAANV
jgi:hypothetical protein